MAQAQAINAEIARTRIMALRVPRFALVVVSMQYVLPRFTSESLRFLRALKRNNRREWFNAHRDDYEAHVRQPMAAIVTRLADDFREFGPEFVANPKTSMYRIYRDIRFSENKAPYKTHVAANFPTRGLPKHEGAGCTSTCRPTRCGLAAACMRRRNRSFMPSASISPRIPGACARWSNRRRSGATSARSRANGCSGCRAASRRITKRRNT